LEDVLTREALVVPGKGDLPHEVRIGGFEPVESLKRGAEPHDAALATHAAHLDGVGLKAHVSILRARHQLPAEPAEALPASELQLLVGLGEIRRLPKADKLRELLQELSDRDEA
jgi:hypothetical protein